VDVTAVVSRNSFSPPRTQSGDAAPVRPAPETFSPAPPTDSSESLAPSQELATPPDGSQVHQAAQEINQRLERLTQPSVRFSVDEESGDLVVRVVDRQTGDVIRQIPPEEMVRLHKHLDEMRGLIFSRQY